MKLSAVLTADLMGSTQLEKGVLDELIEELRDELKDMPAHHIYFYRGDGVQVFLKEPEEAITIAMRMRTRLNKFHGDTQGQRGEKTGFDMAVAVGLGNAKMPVDDLALQNDIPFVLSGRGLEELKKQKRRIGVFTENKQLCRPINTMLFLYEWIMQQWTVPVAATIYHKLHEKKEREIAVIYGISQSAVNQRSRAGCWNGFVEIRQRYLDMIEEGYD